MAAMKAALVLSLALLSQGFGAAGATVTQAAPKPKPDAEAAATATAATPASGKRVAAGSTVTVFRCVDAKGRVTLQDEPCPKGSEDTRRDMVRPRDPPRSSTPRRAPPEPVIYEAPAEEPRFQRELIPPPPMYRCTSYDGNERFSESYDPNPRCEPLVLYYPYPNSLTPAQALGCRWVEDSCVRLSDDAACERWKAQRKEAVSAVTRAFSDTAAYRKSELARLSQIVEESCP